MGLRIQWQQEVPTESNSGIKQLNLVGNDVVAVDDNNKLTMLRLSDGSQIWHAVPLPKREKIFGINRVDTSTKNQIFATTDTDIFVLDANTGHLLTRQNMVRIPTSDITQSGPNLIYGCGDGRVIWHNALVGYELQANRISGTISAQPLLVDTDVLAVSRLGGIILMNDKTAERVWTKQLNAGIEAEPAGSPLAVYIAGLDQTLRCLDRNTGATLWKYFTESPLTQSPVLLGDRVFQHVPSEGFLCLEALPTDAPRGKILWTNPDLKGEIITVLGNDLIVWNAQTRTLMRVDADRGDVIVSSEVPQAEEVQAHRINGNTVVILAFSDDGRVQRLIPADRS